MRMFNLARNFAPIVALLLALSGQAAAAQDEAAAPVTLVGEVMLERSVQSADGSSTTELVAPEVVVPGDRLLFRNTYTNAGTETVERFVVTSPVHAAVRLAPETDPALTVSVDGGTSWGEVAELTVTGTDGTIRAATLDDVTHIRWVLPSVAPGASGTLDYHAIIR